MAQIPALISFNPNTTILSADTNSNNSSIRTVYNAHDTATTSVHGVTGDIVGTSDSQTLTNKTLTSPTITGATMTTATIQMSGRFEYDQGADIASASTITLGSDGNYFRVTGTTTINYITTTDWQSGSIIYLKFEGSMTLTHNAGSVPSNTASLRLSGGGNFSATGGDTLMLVYDQATWREVSRTVI